MTRTNHHSGKITPAERGRKAWRRLKEIRALIRDHPEIFSLAPADMLANLLDMINRPITAGRGKS